MIGTMIKTTKGREGRRTVAPCGPNVHIASRSHLCLDPRPDRCLRPSPHRSGCRGIVVPIVVSIVVESPRLAEFSQNKHRYGPMKKHPENPEAPIKVIPQG